MTCGFMYVFTLVQSHTHVNTVQKDLCGLANWSDICWSHTMKALGSLVTFVRRNSSTVVALRHTYCDMKVWSRMFVVNVQSVSIHHLIWNVISWYTQTSEALAAVYVLKVSSINNMLWYTLRDVLLASVLVTCNVCISAGFSRWATWRIVFPDLKIFNEGASAKDTKI